METIYYTWTLEECSYGGGKETFFPYKVFENVEDALADMVTSLPRYNHHDENVTDIESIKSAFAVGYRDVKVLETFCNYGYIRKMELKRKA